MSSKDPPSPWSLQQPAQGHPGLGSHEARARKAEGWQSQSFLHLPWQPIHSSLNHESRGMRDGSSPKVPHCVGLAGRCVHHLPHQAPNLQGALGGSPNPSTESRLPPPCFHLRKSSATWRGIYKCHLTGLWGEHRDWGVPERPEAHSQAGTNPHQSTSNQGLGTQSLLRDQGIHL